MDSVTPKRLFFTRGVGHHKDKLQSFEVALRNAGIEKYNLVQVSSILPPDCQIITKGKGIASLSPGQITYVVMARESTNEPNRLACAAIGLAKPRAKNQYGYISEHHAFGVTAKQAADFAEDLAATMLGSTLGIDVDADAAWDERKKIYAIDSGCQFVSRSIAQAAEGHKDGLWTTVVAMAVFLME